MKDEQPIRDIEATLHSPDGTPFSFIVSIRRVAEKNGSVCLFKVTGPDPKTGIQKTREYDLVTGEHKSYTDFFENIAHEFGARIPRNSRPFTKATFKTAYRALLTENLAPGILYGYGDPAVLRVEAGPNRGDTWYYLLSTSNDAPDSFPIIRSRDLVNWEFAGFVFPRGNKPAWSADGESVGDYWAPEMHFISGEFRVYFAARHKDTHELCIGLAKSSHPCGPFSPMEGPVLKGNVIDPHVLVENDDMVFLYWKKDNNDIWPGRLNDLLYKHPHLIAKLFPQREDQITASLILTLRPYSSTVEPMERFLVQQPLIEAVISNYSPFLDRLTGLLDDRGSAGLRKEVQCVLQVMKTRVYGQRMSSDGTSLVGERTKIIENDQAWEAHLVEGIWITKYLKRYYLFYSGNDFSTDQYGIGVAISDSPLGPFHKMHGPLLNSTAEWAGPGHPSVVIGPDGNPLLFMHAFFRGRKGYKEFRALLAVPIKFERDQVLLR